jgi:hypothetical protein
MFYSISCVGNLSVVVASDHVVSEKNFKGEQVIGRQYCLPNTVQYTLVQTKRGCCTENWNVIDATLVKTNTNLCRWILKFETQSVDAQGNIIARFKHKVLI